MGPDAFRTMGSLALRRAAIAWGPVAASARPLADALDPADPGGAGPSEVGHALAADADPPYLDAAMTFFDGLRALGQVGRGLPFIGRRDRSAQGLDQFRRKGVPKATARWAVRFGRLCDGDAQHLAGSTRCGARALRSRTGRRRHPPGPVP